MSLELIEKYYNMGLYSKTDLQIFVDAGFLTRDQFDQFINKVE